MQVTVQLDDEARRPIAKINWFNGCRALIDTGALFPIWNKSEDILIRKLGAILVKKDITFGGFGGKAQGNLYRVNFKFDKLYYIDMPIVASELRGTNWHMIISATMFDGMTYEIDTVNKRLSIDTKDNQPIRILRLSDDNNNLSVYLADTYKTKDEYYNNKKINMQDLSANDIYTKLLKEHLDKQS